MCKEKVNQQLLSALKAVMKGSEYKTIMGVTGWHQISMPKESALDLARAAIAAAEAAQPVGESDEVIGFLRDLSNSYHDPRKADNSVLGCIGHKASWLLSTMQEQPASAQPVAVPDGYVLVPVDPTREMMAAFRKEEGKTFPIRYAAMLSEVKKPESKNEH